MIQNSFHRMHKEQINSGCHGDIFFYGFLICLVFENGFLVNFTQNSMGNSASK